jgi:tRNA pseudouridine55 synthase
MEFSKNYFLGGAILLINKPINWTSFQVVNKVRWLIKSKFNLKKIKVGHAGTLDPLAEGLLIICSGKMTKKIYEFQNLDKSYNGTFYLGASTPSFDLETQISERRPIDHINNEMLKLESKKFLGKITQKPPLYSAIKYKGKKLYEFARKGETVDIKSREVIIHEFNIDQIKLPEVNFIVKCSKGTYIRSLVNDFGNKLNCGAHLTRLNRITIGEYDIRNSLSIQEFEKKLSQIT